MGLPIEAAGKQHRQSFHTFTGWAFVVGPSHQCLLILEEGRGFKLVHGFLGWTSCLGNANINVIIFLVESDSSSGGVVLLPTHMIQRFPKTPERCKVQR